MAHLKGVPRSHIYRILRKGEVRVNGGRKKPVYKLEEGDEVRVPPIKIDHSEPATVPDRVYIELRERILYEDERLLVLNKPSGLAVHSGTGIPYGVIEAMKQHHPHCARLELVHRLDRETSGCLLMAKSRKVLNSLQDAFRRRDMHKAYCALLQGELPSASLVVKKSLSKRTIGGEAMVIVDSSGKAAHSIFQSLQSFAGATLARVVIKTGRTHQIRVHAQSIGHPLAGDEKYGDAEFNKYCREKGLKRLFLHAAELAFELDGEEYRFDAPINDELKQLLSQL